MALTPTPVLACPDPGDAPASAGTGAVLSLAGRADSFVRGSFSSVVTVSGGLGGPALSVAQAVTVQSRFRSVQGDLAGGRYRR